MLAKRIARSAHDPQSWHNNQKALQRVGVLTNLII